MTLDQLIALIADKGFSALVALYLLTQVTAQLTALTAEVRSLSDRLIEHIDKEHAT